MKFIHDSWSSFQIEGRDYYIIKEKLKMLKHKLKWSNREVLSLKDVQIENIVKKLNEAKKMAAREALQI